MWQAQKNLHEETVILTKVVRSTLLRREHVGGPSAGILARCRKLTFLKSIISDFKGAGIRTSLFVEAEPKYIEGAKAIQTDRIELYTESYAQHFTIDKAKAVKSFVESAILAKELGLGINAGHDLNLENLKYFANSVPFLDEVSIGHALISDALYLGLEKTIESYKNCLIK